MVYFTLLVLWVIIANFFSKRISAKHGKKYFCWMVFVPATLLMGLRSRYVGGVDTDWYYIPEFQSVCESSWKELFALFGGKDPLFYICAKLFSYISTNPYAFIFVISVVIMAAYTLFVYRYSAQPAISFLVFFALGYYTAGFQFLRHMIALSVLLFAYPYILNKKPVKFVLLVLLAATIHSTALVFLLAYPFAHTKIGWKQWMMIIAAVVVSYAFRSQVFDVLEMLLGNSSRFAKFTTGTYGSQISIVGFILLLYVYAVSYFVMGKRKKKKPEIQVIFNLSAISLCFMSMIILLGEFVRISMFFGMYNTLLLPHALTNQQIWKRGSKMKVFVTMAVCLSLIAYFLLFRVENDFLANYAFFWND